MKLVLFDLDNTLLDGDSDYEWAQFLIEKEILDRDEYESRNQDFYREYQNGTLDIVEFLDFQLRPLSEYSRAQLNQWHEEFMKVKVHPMITQAARDLVLQFSGDLVAIVTATNSFITRPIADEFGIEHLIATEPEEIEGEFTGNVVGEPSFREGKVSRVNQWLNAIDLSLTSFEEALFFSDSINDLPLLDVVQTPIAVNPDPKLLDHARLKGWEVLQLHRKQ
ncbi:MAG: HAD family phosphatase [Proteobacteria bacterium]|nr:HAD family phosphatase [Pseudomonadota bacterium]MDA1012064.1 HAD family phosphatase [Pseudomonadota bacterium]